ncbi:hypothetical protein [Stenotrophomonas maltophilia]|uniref:hypothetical protein n=1 Tax=Stenotrophomonas maltophilia TaxID=40324 RepID=UPI002B1D4018|nr:hypothetical protein [Stenotrophomonas maltophilia]
MNTAPATDTAATNREAWLNSLAALMAPAFVELGAPLPAFRIAVGFPSSGMNSAAIGECWDAKASADGTFEIFIRPDQADPLAVAFVLAHELVHAAVGLEHGHKGEFARVALALGFPRPLTTAAPPTGRLLAWFESLLPQVGPLPHAAMRWRMGGGTVARRKGGGVMVPVPDAAHDGEGGEDRASSRPKKQTTRLHKASCSECGYTVRVTSKWLEIGPPHCPAHGAMTTDDDGSDQSGE